VEIKDFNEKSVSEGYEMLPSRSTKGKIVLPWHKANLETITVRKDEELNRTPE